MAVETVSTQQILGVGLGGLLDDLLKKGERPQIRVSGFSGEEVAYALKHAGLDRQGSSEAMVLVSGSPASIPGDLLDEVCFTSNGRTATYGRNHNQHGFVYFQLKQESDSQSTQAMYHLRDSDFFEDRRWLHLLAAISPTSDNRLPNNLVGALEEFVLAYQATWALQLRPFANFVERIGRKWTELGQGELSHAQLVEVIDTALPGMKLFRYRQLSHALAKRKRGDAARQIKKLLYGSRLIRSSGAELDRTKLLARLRKTRLDPENEQNNQHLVQAAEDFISDGDSAALHALDFERFSLCLSSSSTRTKKLGTAALQELRRHQEEDLLKSFEELEAQGPLDDRDGDFARAFIHEGAFGVLSSGLQRQIKRLIPRQESFEDAMLGLLKVIEDARNEDTQSLSIHLDQEGSAALRRLFGVLYGPRLCSMVRNLEGTVAIALGDDIRNPVEESLEPVTTEDDEESHVDEARELTITVQANPGDAIAFTWVPEDTSTWLLWTRCIADQEFQSSPALRQLQDQLSNATTPASLSVHASGSPDTPKQWVQRRKMHMEALGRHGLTSNRVKELHTDWLQALRGLLAENVAPEKLAAFLAGDCVQLVEQGRQSRPEASTVWMLGTHPLRLRWFISWREELCRYIEGVLSNNLQLSSVNSEYWRQQMASWSAHRYPPVLSIQPGHVHLPVEERGNCERYIPANISHDHGDVVDPRAVKTLVSVGRSYLQTYPYKRDGFHVLFRLGHDGGLVREFVREFVRREPDARLVLHVVTDATSRAVAGLVDTYDNEALLHSTPHSHFPQLEVRHYIDDGDDNTLPASLTSNTVIDLAVVPFLFSGHADISMADDLASASRGHHEKPVLYRPQHTDRDQRSLIINLRPAARDEYLDQWGDAVARVYNRGSVGGESSISYLRLYSDMDQTSHRLQDYLNVAQQVVTIDIGVRRSQLLALVNKPEVTHVYTGVGKNGDYSLVLASNQVVRSLEGRLEELLELHFNPLEKLRQQTIRDIKAHIDLLGPNLVLQACARSAHAAELLGRWALVQWTQQNSPSQGKTWWINLDDHKSWFPGRHADLLRVSVRRDSHSNEVSLSLLVCESKLSTQGSAIASASSELRSTMDLLQDTLPTGQTKSANHELHQRLDQGIWNNALAAAIDDAFSTQNSPLDQDVRDDIMKGMFKVESLEGVGLIWRLENPEPATQESTRENVQIWSLNRETMAQLLGLT